MAVLRFCNRISIKHASFSEFQVTNQKHYKLPAFVKNISLINRTKSLNSFYVSLWTRAAESWGAVWSLESILKFGEHFEVWRPVWCLEISLKFGEHFEVWRAVWSLESSLKFGEQFDVWRAVWSLESSLNALN